MDWIIIVDDSPTCLKIVVQLLGAKNKKVTPFVSVVDFLEFYEKKVNEDNMPDIVMMDIAMPLMNGFEAVEKMRFIESSKNIPNSSVVFITAEEDSGMETMGFKIGAADYIKKPLDIDVVNQRLDNIIKTKARLREIERMASTDQLTGFLNKQIASEKITELCNTKRGCLMVMDIDSFKLVNDIHGHAMGDQILKKFTDIVMKNIDFENVIGRIGGDEFLIFAEGVTDEFRIRLFTDNLNDKLTKEAKKIFGDNVNIPLGVSIGAVFVPDAGTDFSELFRLADQALYSVKNNGKHGYAIYKNRYQENIRTVDLKTITSILDERSYVKNAIWMGEDAFIGIYRYMLRYVKRYHRVACRVLLSLDFSKDVECNEQTVLTELVRKNIQDSLRNSDIMMQTGACQFFLLLPEVHDEEIDQLMARIMESWNTKELRKRLTITYEANAVNFETDS